MRGFFQKIGFAVARFMYGRNGADALCITAFALYFVLLLLSNLMIGVSEAAYVVVTLAAFGAAAYAFFRSMSRNVFKRRAENAAFVGFFAKIKKRILGFKTRLKDKEHKYFKCKKCKARLRVPRGRGKIVITCAKCGNKFDAKT